MDFRLAEMSDLPELKIMYKSIIDNMYKNNIHIWDEIYPCEFFQQDIKNNRLYILKKGSDIAAAFALSETNEGEQYLKWNDLKSKAFYIDRFGVNVNFLRLGLGELMLKNAAGIAKQKGARYLRLFVVDINKPAINLYSKCGFNRVDGAYEMNVDDTILHEYGFEIEI
jgi:Acetyltransferases